MARKCARLQGRGQTPPDQAANQAELAALLEGLHPGLKRLGALSLRPP